MKITILMIPQAKQRATTIVRQVPGQETRRWTYSPKKTTDAENFIRKSIVEAKQFFPDGQPVSMEAWFYLPMPVSKPKSRTYPVTKPDLDNLEKLLCDACRKFIYHDDAQICDKITHKRYGHPPRIELEINSCQTLL